MKRALLALCLLACGEDVEAQAIGGGAVGGGGGGAAADPTPVFDFDPGAHGSGPAQLTVVPTFGGTSMTEVVNCDARDDNGTNWVCDTGGTFTEQGAPTNNRAAPFTEAASRATYYASSAAHRAPNTTAAEVDTEDFVLLVVFFSQGNGAEQYVVDKYSGTNGYAIRQTTGNVLQGVVNGTTVGSYTNDTIGQWNIAHLMCDSGAATTGARFYINGAIAGSAASCPSSLAAASNNFEIAGLSNTTTSRMANGFVALVRAWTCAGCMTTTADMDAVAKEQAYRLMGIWPTEAVVSAPTLSTRASPQYIDIMREDFAVALNPSRTFRVGNGWLGVGQRKEATLNGRVIRGYLSENIVTNKALQSIDLTTTWAKLTAADTVTANAITAPNQLTEVERYTAAVDAVGVEHGVRQAITLTAAHHNISVHTATLGTGTERQYLWIRDNTLSDAIAWFDIRACLLAEVGTGLSVHTGSPATTAARIVHMGKDSSSYYWCRPSIMVLGTAASHDIDIGWSEAPGVTTFTTAGSETVGYLWGVQVEAVAEGVQGETASSLIVTTTGTAQRLNTNLTFNITNAPSAGGTMFASWLTPDTKVNGSVNGKDGSGVPCAIMVDTNNRVLFEQTREAQSVNRYGSGAYVRTGGTFYPAQRYGEGGFSGRNGLRHSMTLKFFTDDVRHYVDNDPVARTSATTATLPTMSGGAIGVGYANVSNVQWMNGLVERCVIWSSDVDAEGNYQP